MLRSIRYQLAAMVLGLVVFAIAVSMSISYLTASEDFETQIVETNRVMAESLAFNISQFMTNAYNLSTELAKNPDVTSFVPLRQKGALDDMVERYPFFQLLITHLPDGTQTARTSGALTNRAERWWFKDYMASRTPYISKSYYSVFSNTTVVSIVQGIQREDELQGVLLANIETATLKPMVEKFNAGPDSYAYLLDAEGAVMVHPDKRQVEELYNYKTQKKIVLQRNDQGVALRDDKGNEITAEVPFTVAPDLKRMIDKVMRGETGHGEYTDSDGQSYLCTYRSISLPGGSAAWNLIMVQKKSTALAFLRNMAIKNSAIGFAVILLSLGLTYWVASRITRPLLAIIGATRQVAAGDFSVQLPPLRHGDEISQLGESVTKMTGNLRQMMSELAEKNQQLLAEIEERRQAQATLAASEEKFAKAFRYATDVVGIVKLQTETYLEVSDAFYTLLGYPAAEVIGHTSQELGLWCHPAERRRMYELIQAGQTVRNQEVCWLTKNGMQRTGGLSIEPIEINQEPCLLFLWHDVTEAKAAASALQEAKNELEVKVEIRTQELSAANEELLSMNETLTTTLLELQRTQDQLIQTGKMASLGRLVAGVAHEVNTPLGVSVTAASYLQEVTQTTLRKYEAGALSRKNLEEFFQEARQSQTIVLTNLERAAHLINSFKKVSVDQSYETKRKFAVKEYLAEVLLTLQPKLKKTPLTVRLEGEATLIVDTYAGALAQIITNFIDNSLVHAYPAGQAGAIVIAFAVQAGVFQLTYRDDGKGMPPEVVERVFEPFFTTNRSDGGTGLGMHIVYNIVAQTFKGTITCQSQLGQGTEFVITFPLG